MTQKSWDWLRRGLGALFLLAAAVMVVLGLVSQAQHLQGRAFLRYWTVCWAFTTVAMIFALWDLRIIRARARAEKRRLLDDAVSNLQREVKKSGSERDGG